MKKIKNIEDLVDYHYEEIFEWLCDHNGDQFDEIMVEIRIKDQGKTIRRSWLDREKMLAQSEVL